VSYRTAVFRLVSALGCGLLPSSFAAAQSTTPSGEIRGRVVHAGSTVPIPSATVDVTSGTVGGSSAHVATGADGSFHVTALRAGRYRVMVRALGFARKTLPIVELSAEHSEVDVGVIALTAAVVQLQEQAITAQRQEVQVTPDRTVYVVRDMPTTKGGTALDVLRNVPSVDVDIDNNVSLRGNSGVVVQINGRPSPLKAAQLGNFLEQLPADAVDHVEIVPNPSARDDPEGVAGIVNIVLRQKPDAGTSGGVTIGGGTTGHVDVGGNAGIQRGPFSAYGSYSLLRDSRPRTEAVFRQNNYETPLTYLRESGVRTQIPLVHTLTGNASYELGDHDELSLDALYSQRREWESYGVLYHTLDTAFTLTSASDRRSKDVNHEGSAEAAMEYKHGFAAKGHTLTSELRFEEHLEGGPTDILEHALTPAGVPTSTTLQETQTAWTHSSSTSLKADYVRPLGEHLKLETGYKGSLQRIRTTMDVQVYDFAAARYATDTGRASNFAYDQLVNAGYGMADAQFGKIQLQGGVRVERAATTFDVRTRNQRYENPYASVFPSGLVAYSLDDSHQLKLSYSTRIRRPDDEDMLDPTPHALDPLNISVGNPYLQPEYIRALELGFQRTGEHVTVQVTPFYRHTLDAVRSIRTIDTNGVATRTFANIATSDAWGMDATVALGGGSRLSGFLGGSAYRQQSNAGNLDPTLSARTFGWSIRTNAGYRVSRTIDAQALVAYVAPMTVEQGWNAARTRVSAAIRDKLVSDRLSLTLRITDPFSMARERSITTDPRFYQVSDRTRSARGVLLSVSWTFGKPPKRERDQIDLNETP
jgi:outer membrane cobalamin receptor